MGTRTYLNHLLYWHRRRQRTNSFDTYLLFQAKPYTNSIAIPMYKMKWGWSGSATNNPWGKRSGAIFSTSPSLTEELPAGTHTSGQIDTSPQFMFRTNCFNEN